MSTGADPIADADRWLAGAAIERSNVLFVIGIGAGHVLAALDRRGWRGRVIALELAGTTLAPPRPNVPVLVGPAYDGLDRAVLDVEPDVEHPVIVGDPALIATRRDDVVQASRLIVKAWFGARANQDARRRFAGPYLLNTLRNVPAVASEGDAASLVGAFPGVPAVVVAAGPSLDHVLDEIAAVRDRALVVAVDTATRPLLGAGIAPDLVVALDPSEVNATHLTDLPPCPETVLVAESSLDTHAIAAFRGRIVMFRVADHHPWPWLRSAGLDRHLLRAWGSVLTTAFDLTLQMGCDPIAFVGADLAFTAGRPYARGTTFEDEWRRAQAWRQSLEASWAERVAAWPETFDTGVHGVPVRTAPHLRAFRDWIVTEAGRAAGRTVVNATGDGILVGPAIQQRRLTDAMAQRPRLVPEVRARLAALRVTAQPVQPSPLPPPSEATERTWMAVTGVSADAIRDALQPPTPPADAVGPAPATPETPAVADDRDAAFLRELVAVSSVQIVTLTAPDHDLLGELRQRTTGLPAGEAVVIVDDLGLGQSAQVRRAVDALLCERDDLRLDYRRFVDHASRLTVLYGDAAQRTPPPSEADADKWTPDHRAIAERLTPHLARVLQPRSAIDLGCGAGYWLEALKAHGVADVHGLSARNTALDALPPATRRYDACLCLEVAQGLPPSGQDALIARCTDFSDTVVFASRQPGAPGASPHARPLPYWAAKFWRHGYVLDDRVRQDIELHTPFPVSIYDVLLVFRRVATPPASGEAPSEAFRTMGDLALAMASRLHDLYTQKIWWAVAAIDLETAAAETVEAPAPQLVSWVVPASRWLPGVEGGRVLRLRSDAARWYVSHPSATIRILEDGVPLPELPLASLGAASGGGWARWRDELHLRVSDGGDPRTNGRAYALVVPTHVAWAERQSFARALAHGF